MLVIVDVSGSGSKEAIERANACIEAIRVYDFPQGEPLFLEVSHDVRVIQDAAVFTGGGSLAFKEAFGMRRGSEPILVLTDGEWSGSAPKDNVLFIDPMVMDPLNTAALMEGLDTKIAMRRKKGVS